MGTQSMDAAALEMSNCDFLTGELLFHWTLGLSSLCIGEIIRICENLNISLLISSSFQASGKKRSQPNLSLTESFRTRKEKLIRGCHFWGDVFCSFGT